MQYALSQHPHLNRLVSDATSLISHRLSVSALFSHNAAGQFSGSVKDGINSQAQLSLAGVLFTFNTQIQPGILDVSLLMQWGHTGIKYNLLDDGISVQIPVLSPIAGDVEDRIDRFAQRLGSKIDHSVYTFNLPFIGSAGHVFIRLVDFIARDTIGIVNPVMPHLLEQDVP